MAIPEMPVELAEWLEDGLMAVLDGKSRAICIAAISEDGEQVLTGYYHCNAQDKAILAHNIYTDALKDTLYNNLDRLKEALEGLEEEDGDGE